MELFSFALNVILVIFLGWREYANDKKTHDMLDRLMAKDLSEYKQETKPDEVNEQPPEDTTQDLDDSFSDITEVLNDDK